MAHEGRWEWVTDFRQYTILRKYDYFTSVCQVFIKVYTFVYIICKHFICKDGTIFGSEAVTWHTREDGNGLQVDAAFHLTSIGFPMSRITGEEAKIVK